MSLLDGTDRLKTLSTQPSVSESLLWWASWSSLSGSPGPVKDEWRDSDVTVAPVDRSTFIRN